MSNEYRYSLAPEGGTGTILNLLIKLNVEIKGLYSIILYLVSIAHSFIRGESAPISWSKLL